MTRAVNYFAWQAKLAMAPLGSRVVEVGCGIGNFTRMIADRELDEYAPLRTQAAVAAFQIDLSDTQGRIRP